MAKAFVRAYRRTRAYLNEAPAAEIARAEKRFFPQIDEAVLADCIATYQQLGCWTPHVEITQPAFEATLDVFAYNGLLKRRFRYAEVCAALPAPHQRRPSTSGTSHTTTLAPAHTSRLHANAPPAAHAAQ